MQEFFDNLFIGGACMCCDRWRGGTAFEGKLRGQVVSVPY